MSKRYFEAIVSSGELSEAAIRKIPEANATIRHVGGRSERAARQ